MNELAQNLSKALKNFSDRRVINEAELKAFSDSIVAILKANKVGVETLNTETKQQLKQVLEYINNEHNNLVKQVRGDLSLIKSDVEKATKEQNDRAFKRLQTLIAAIRMPKDGVDGKDGKDGNDGKDGSPDTATQVRDKLESLKDDERLDASAIKNLPKWIERKGKQMMVGGIRFLEQLVDVSILPTKKRQDLLIQYNDTNKRWENGVALTVGTTQPTSPEVGDLWIDTN